MSRVLWHVTMSVDGFIAGPGGAMDWMPGPNVPVPEAEMAIPDIGAALTGRRTWDAGRRPTGPDDPRRRYGEEWAGPVFVLTHRPPAPGDPAATSGDPEMPVTFVSEGVHDAVERALEAADGADVLLLGADVARQCLEAGLVDDLLVHVAPVLLGAGVPLFAGTAGSIGLSTTAVSRSGDLATLRFQVVP